MCVMVSVYTMESIWIRLCLAVLSFMTTAHCVTINSTADVKITASPGNLLEGFTKHMSINCTFLHETNSDFSTLMSLILSKTDSLEDNVFKEVAAMSSNSPHTVQVKDALGAQVTGQLSVTDDSFVTFEWLYPTSQVQGRYKCEAYGMDDTGHPRVSAASVDVTESVVDLNQMFLDKLRELDLAQDALNGRLQDLETRVNNSRDAIMLASANYGGHTYYVSSVLKTGHAESQSLCELHGGYLVEINNEPEHDFIAEFLNNNTVKNYVMVGEHKPSGTWTFMSSGQPVTYFKWSTQTQYTCMFLKPGATWLMHAAYCYAADYQNLFMCEMPF